MIKNKISFGVLMLIFLLVGCKSEFERIRTSGDPTLMKEKADTYFEEEDYTQAQTLYEAVIPFYRGKKESANIFFNYAYTHYYLNEFLLANHYFKNFANTFTTDPNREEAQFMAAYSNYRLSPNAKLDQSYSELAINEFQLFINTFPNSDRVEEATKLIEDMRSKQELKAYNEGELYFNIGQFQSAIVSYENMLSQFPESDKAEEVKYKTILSAYKLAKNSVYAKKQERYENVIKRIDKFVQKNPKSKYRRELLKLKDNSKEQLILL